MKRSASETNTHDKSAVLQATRGFNETPIHAGRSRDTLQRVAVLAAKGALTRTEATAAFFSTTKLFQSTDVGLRQMLCVAIKELAPFADDTMMVTASLAKDAARLDAATRPNALRALAVITPPSMLQGIERFIKQALTDRNPSVCAAALVSCFHFMATRYYKSNSGI